MKKTKKAIKSVAGVGSALGAMMAVLPVATLTPMIVPVIVSPLITAQLRK